MMRRLGGADRIHGDFDVAIRAVFETHRTRQTRSELAMHLAFGGARPDGAPRNEIADILRRDGVEELTSNRHSRIVQIAQQLASNSETVVNAVTAVEFRVINQTLPTDRC